MKTHLDIKHEGTLGSDGRTRMTFDENSIAHLMSILTDMYSDPELAVIREYSTNARDAHVAAGNTAPIEVDLPNALSPNLVIRDRGIGLSVDSIHEEFSKYGWSSKRDTDEQVGQLGIGCKSGLAYTTQFTMTSVKDGVKATVLITREEDGAASLQVVDTCSTTDPNGVEIRIPAKAGVTVHGFNWKAQRFFRVWERGTVLVDGEAPAHVWDQENAIVIDPDIVLVPADGGTDYLVMGNVPYPIKATERLINARLKRGQEFSAIVRVPIGSINFTPSREQLNYTKRTIETLHEARTFIAHKLRGQAQEEINAATTAGEALATWRRWDGLIERHDLYWDGSSLPYNIDIEKHAVFELRITGDGYRRRGSTQTGRLYQLTLDKGWQAKVHVVGFTGDQIPPAMKARARHWANENVKDIAYDDFMLFYDKPIGAGFLDGVTVVDYETIKAVVMPKGDGGSRAPRLPYAVVDYNGASETTDTFPADAVCWMRATLDGGSTTRSVAYRFARVNKKQIMSVNKREESSFQKKHPELPHFTEWVATRAKELITGATEWEWYDLRPDVRRHGRHLHGVENLRYLAIDKVMDPELRGLIKSYHADRARGDKRLLEYWDALQTACEHFKLPVPKARVSKLVAELDLIGAKYPLVLGKDRSLRSADCEAVTEYVNVMYIVHEQMHLHPAML